MQVSVGSLAWYSMLCGCLLASLYQVEQLVADWERRPMDIVQDVRAKQDIPFPSITVCPEGTTLNPALEMYFNKKQLDYRDFPRTVKSYFSLQMEGIRFYMRLQEISMPSPREVSAKSFYLFVTFVNNIIGEAVTKGLLYDKVMGLYNSVKGELAEDALQGLLGKNITGGMLENNEVDFGTYASLYACLTAIRVAKRKSVENKVNVMALFLGMLQDEKQFNASGSNNDSITFPKFTLANYNYREGLRTPPVLTSSHVNHAEHIWSLNTTVLRNNQSQDLLLHEGQNLTNVKQLYIIYMQLIYLQTNDLDKNLGSKLAQLLVYENYEKTLPDSVECAYRSELKEFFKNQSKSAGHSLDLIETTRLLTTLSGGKLHAIFSNMRSNKCNLSSPVGERVSLHLFSIIKLVEHYKFDYCKNRSDLKLCKLLNETSSFSLGNNDLLELLHNSAHPPMYLQNTSVSSQPMSVVPFCFIGNQIPKVFKKLNSRLMYKEIKYSFCTDVQHAYTDTGLCTAINFPDQAKVFTEDFLAYKNAKIRKEKPLTYPQQTSVDGTKIKNIEQSEDGVLLVLDSSAFGNTVSKNRDLFSGSIYKDNKLAESAHKNNFRIALHDKNEIPTLNQPQSITVRIEKSRTDLTVPFLRLKVKVYADDAEENIRSLSIKTRKCRFEDETRGMSMFKVYSETNCIYECKIELCKKKCNCVPWNFPHSSSDRVCDPIGNLCFRNHMLMSLDNMISLESIGKPPCGCYPSCRKHQYIPVGKEIELAASGWLEPDKMISIVNELRQPGGGVLDLEYWIKIDYLDLFQQTKYLTPFIFNSVSPTWSPAFPQRETIGHLKYLFSNETARHHGAKNTRLEDRIRNLAIVHINFDRENYQVRTKLMRTSFSMMLSSFGGILGLFTGFSFMTLIDIFCWLNNSAKKGSCGNCMLAPCSWLKGCCKK